MGSGCLLPGGDGDLDLSLTWDTDPESLLLGGTFCVLLTQGDGDLSLDISLNLAPSTLVMDLGWDRDHVLLQELTLPGVPEADLALPEKFAGLCSKPIDHINFCGGAGSMVPYQCPSYQVERPGRIIKVCKSCYMK